MSSVRYGDWIGTTATMGDVIDLWPARALHAALDHEGAPPACGDALPGAWHWLYFRDARPGRALGRDGHPLRGGFAPPVALPRRMWAGGRIRLAAALRVGDEVVRVSRIADIREKTGRSGPLVFVSERHDIYRQAALVISEERDIVYREDPRSDAVTPEPPQAPETADWSQMITADPVLLFRYSALTFNGHRIHYDRRYCTEVEGYPGLVVHGPLLATLLMGLGEAHAPEGGVAEFSYRAVSPVFDGEPFRIAGRAADGGCALWVARADGALAMEGRARFHEG